MADEADSKSVVGNNVRVQVPPPALKKVLTPFGESTFSFILNQLILNIFIPDLS